MVVHPSFRPSVRPRRQRAVCVLPHVMMARQLAGRHQLRSNLSSSYGYRCNKSQYPNEGRNPINRIGACLPQSFGLQTAGRERQGRLVVKFLAQFLLPGRQAFRCRIKTNIVVIHPCGGAQVGCSNSVVTSSTHSGRRWGDPSVQLDVCVCWFSNYIWFWPDNCVRNSYSNSNVAVRHCSCTRNLKKAL